MVQEAHLHNQKEKKRRSILSELQGGILPPE